MLAGCVLLGAGGHARVLLDCLRAAGFEGPLALLDRDTARHGGDVDGAPVVGGDDQLATLGPDYTHFVVAVGSVGDASARRRLFEQARGCGLEPLSVRHPTACVSPSARLRAGSQLLPGAIVNAAAEVGMNAIVNSGAIVEHDCVVGDHAHVASGAALASGVVVGAEAHVGIGAVVRQGICIGRAAVVGAGAAVVAAVAPRTVVAGVPARVLKEGSA